MAYEKLNLTNGVDKWRAEHVVHLENGIIANEKELENKQPKGNYLTEHQKLKTINGQAMAGEGDFSIDVLSETAKSLLITILKNAVFTSDQSDAISHLENELLLPETENEGVTQLGSVLRITHSVDVSQDGSTLAIM